MSTLNELVRNADKEWGRIVEVLLHAHAMGNRDYLTSALDVIHEEFTFWAGESVSDESMRRLSILHALHCASLGLLNDLEGKGAPNNVPPLVEAIEDMDLSALTETMANMVMLRVRGAAINVEIGEASITDPLLRSIIESFVALMRHMDSVLRKRGTSQ
jgi:hypothetical protein